jgi:hypothetical protein
LIKDITTIIRGKRLLKSTQEIRHRSATYEDGCGIYMGLVVMAMSIFNVPAERAQPGHGSADDLYSPPALRAAEAHHPAGAWAR